MIQIYRAPELPGDVPAMLINDGGETAVLVNPALIGDRGVVWMRSVVNALLAAAALALAVAS